MKRVCKPLSGKIHTKLKPLSGKRKYVTPLSGRTCREGKGKGAVSLDRAIGTEAAAAYCIHVHERTKVPHIYVSSP